MLACSCLMGFWWCGGGRGGDGGRFLSGMFQSSMRIALHVTSSSLTFGGRGVSSDVRVGFSFSGVGGWVGRLGMILMLRDQSSIIIFPSFHDGTVEGASVDAVGIGLNSKFAIWTLQGTKGCNL